MRASGGMADALASGASVRKDVGVQVPPRAHIANFRTYVQLSGCWSCHDQELLTKQSPEYGCLQIEVDESFTYWESRAK